jgi:flagellar basal-body rod modification protein FlgD
MSWFDAMDPAGSNGRTRRTPRTTERHTRSPGADVTDPITPTGVVSPISQLISNGTTSVAKDGSELGKDAFLKLLVAQLKYQDPSKPVDSSQFMAQTAQFTQVEKLEELTKNSGTSLTLQQGLAASNLVGKSVTWLDAEGASHDGVVAKASFGGGLVDEPLLQVGTDAVPLSRVTGVKVAG